MATPGFQLPARYVIHTVGPTWQGGGQAELLADCYRNSLELAQALGCRSIAFPLISSGIYGYPKEQAMAIAVSAIRRFLEEKDMDVTLCVFDRGAVLMSQGLLGRLQSYIDAHYLAAHDNSRSVGESAAYGLGPTGRVPMATSRSLRDLLDNLDESFNRMLLRLIDEKGMTDVEVYKRANLDRKLISKLRREGYSPSKPTAVALAIALRLSLDETKDFLGKAGYSLTRSCKFDVIIEFFIAEQNYDIMEINVALFAFDQKLLGA